MIEAAQPDGGVAESLSAGSPSPRIRCPRATGPPRSVVVYAGARPGSVYECPNAATRRMRYSWNFGAVYS